VQLAVAIINVAIDPSFISIGTFFYNFGEVGIYFYGIVIF